MISFDLSSIPSNAVVESATLEINYSGLDDACAYNDMTANYITEGSYTAHKITKEWDEVASVKWSTHATSINSTEEDTYNFVPGSCTWADFDVTDAVSKMVSGDEDNNGFMIVTHSPVAANSTSGWDGLWTYFASSDTSEVSIRPKLTVTYQSGEAIIATKSSLGNALSLIVSNRELQIDGLTDSFTGSIRNSKGQVVHTFTGLGTTKVSVPHEISSGLYIIEIESSALTTARRLFLQ